MKEINNQPKTELAQEQNQKQEYKQVGSIYMKTGCKLFAYNTETVKMEEVKQANLTKGIVNFDGTPHTERQTQYNPACLYFQAINLKNAMRKLSKYQAGDYSHAETFETRTFEKLPTLY